jgi:hypothetical protein
MKGMRPEIRHQLHRVAVDIRSSLDKIAFIFGGADLEEYSQPADTPFAGRKQTRGSS